MRTNPYDHMLSEALTPEALVRRALRQMEADFRELVLLALADWQQLRVISPQLFREVACLSRPSWGRWNGLLQALREARKNVLRIGEPAVRERVKQAAVFNEILDGLEREADASLGQALRPLAQQLRTTLPGRPRLAHVLTLPITLRNDIAHFCPTEPEWWQGAADNLHPLLALLASRGPSGLVPGSVTREHYRVPWFLGGGAMAFNGLADRGKVLYASPAGQASEKPEMYQPLRAALAFLLGREETQADQLDRLSELVPGELKGVLLGDYLVYGPPVGQGGYATVYAATQVSTGRKVAVKILQEGLSEDSRARFQQEAAFLSQFNHPHIVGVIGYGEEPWFPPREPALSASLAKEAWFQEFSRAAPTKTFLVLEWVEGQTLEQVFLGQRQPGPALVEKTAWLAEAANALAAVHAAGLIHRDVKPSNLMVTMDGQLKLMDFGIARTQDETRTLKTTQGRVLGTPSYMSPEQLAAHDLGDESGPASDVYSLCATFYELFAGVRVFRHDSETAESVRTRKILGERPEPPRHHAQGLPWELDTILMGGLEFEPSHRFRSMHDLEGDVRNFLAHRPIEYKKPSYWRRLQLWYKRSPALAWTSTAAAALLLILTVTAVSFAAFQSEANSTITLANNNLTISKTRLEETTGELKKSNRELGKANGDLKDTNLRLVETDLKRAAALRQAGGLALNQGLDLARDQGDIRTGLLWLTHALELIPPEDTEMQYVVRANLTAWRRHLSPLKMTFPRVNGVVSSVAISPDGRTVLSTGAENGVRVHDVATGQPLVAPLRHGEAQGEIRSVAFSPDGRRLLTTSSRAHGFKDGKEMPPAGELRIWASETFRLIASASMPGSVGQAAFRPDGGAVVTVGFDGTARLWEATTGNALGGPIPNVVGFMPQFSPDSKHLLVRSGPKTVRVHDAGDGKPIAEPMEHGENLTCASFAEGSSQVWTGGKDRIRKWNAVTAKELGKAMWTQGTVHAFSPGAQAMLTSNSQGIWIDKVGGYSPKRLQFRFPIETFAFSQDGRLLLTGGGDQSATQLSDVTLVWNGEARLFDVATGKSIGQPMRHPFPVMAVALSGDGRTIATGTGVRQINPILITGPDGKEIDTGTGGELRVWEVGPGDLPPTRTWGVKGWPSADGGKNITMPSSHDRGRKACEIFDAATGKASGGKLPFPEGWPVPKKDKENDSGAEVCCLWSSPEGRTIVACTQHRFFPKSDGQMRFLKGPLPPQRSIAVLWRWQDGRASGPGRCFPDNALPIGFAQDGRRCLVLADKAVQWWSVEQGRPVGEPVSLPSTADIAILSPDEATLFLGQRKDSRRFIEAFTPQAHLIDLKSGKPVGPPLSHPSGVTSAAFSPDSKYILIGTGGKIARLWHARTGQPAGAALNHAAFVDSVAFSPDGRLVATEGAGRVNVWHAASSQPLGPPFEGSGQVAFGAQGRVIRTSQKIFGDSRVTEWELPGPVDLSVQSLVLATQVLGETALDPGGLVRHLENEEWTARRLELTRTAATSPHLAAFAQRPTADAAWHADLADRFEKIQNWTGALRHLDTALEMTPDDAVLLRRRGNVYTSLNRLDEAVADFSRSVTLRPNEADAWAGRGRIQASRDQWQEAARDLRTAIELQPDDSGTAYRLGLVLLASGDEPGYRKECLRMLERFGPSNDRHQLDDVAFLATLRPRSTDRSAELVKLAARLVNLSPGEWSFLETYGAALYRDEQYEKAVDQLNQAVKANSAQATSWTAYFLAMAHRRLGNRKEAEEWLAKAHESEKKNAGTNWMEKVRCRFLREEAQRQVFNKNYFLPDGPDLRSFCLAQRPRQRADARARRETSCLGQPGSRTQAALAG